MIDYLTDSEIEACWKATDVQRLIPSFAEQIQASIIAKCAANNEALADARRYRFIANGGAYIEPDGERIYMAIDSGAYYSAKADLDAAIDAAIQKPNKELGQ